MKILLKTAILVAIAAAAQTLTVQAQNPNYVSGDLVLYFQQFGGTKTLYVRLGDTALDFRGTVSGPGAPDKINFLNINAALESAFGLDWETDTTLYAGLAGNWGNDNTDNETLQNGDPQRTIYVSDQRDTVGSVGVANSSGYNLVVAGNTAMTTFATRILTQNNVLEASSVSAVAEIPLATSQIDNQNPITGGVQGTAFASIGGGVQQVGSASTIGTFGAAGSVEFALDLYRILGTTTAPGQVGGTLRQGTFEGTVTVSSTGQVSFISQGASTPYDTWMATFPTITAPADKLETADPDGDGFKNLMEFVLNGNPSVSNTSIAPTLDASGSNFVFNFNRRDDSESPETTLVFQHSPDLVTWTDVSIGSGTAGVVTVNENGAAADGIIVTIPKGVNTKLFGRLKVVR